MKTFHVFWFGRKHRRHFSVMRPACSLINSDSLHRLISENLALCIRETTLGCSSSPDSNALYTSAPPQAKDSAIFSGLAHLFKGDMKYILNEDHWSSTWDLKWRYKRIWKSKGVKDLAKKKKEKKAHVYHILKYFQTFEFQQFMFSSHATLVMLLNVGTFSSSYTNQDGAKRTIKLFRWKPQSKAEKNKRRLAEDILIVRSHLTAAPKRLKFTIYPLSDSVRPYVQSHLNCNIFHKRKKNSHLHSNQRAEPTGFRWFYLAFFFNSWLTY